MPSVSKAQQRFMGLVHAYKKGEVPASKVSKAVKDAAKSMKKKSTKKFASTKHDDLPNKVRSESTKSYGKSLAKIAKDRQLKSLSKKDRETLMKISKMMKKANESVNEDGHTDVASIERKLKLIIQDSVDVIKKLRSMSNEDSLPSWWTDKITLAKDYVGKSRDFIMNPTEEVDEGFGGELTGEDKKKFEKARKENAEQLGYKVTGTSDIKEATSLGADMLLGGIATVVKKAGMRPKSAKMMGGGFKVSKRDKVGFKIDVEIRGMDKKKTFPLQFETERGMLYVVIKNKPIKLGKYTMVNQAAQNLKKVGAALIGDKNIKRIA